MHMANLEIRDIELRSLDVKFGRSMLEVIHFFLFDT